MERSELIIDPPPISSRNHPPLTSPRNHGEAFKLPSVDGGTEGGERLRSELIIHKSDHNGDIRITYSARLVDDTEAIIVLARWQQASVLLPYVTFGVGDLLVETFYRRRYYNIFALYDGSDALPEVDLTPIVERIRLEFRQNNTSMISPEQLRSQLSCPCPLKGYYVNFTYPAEYDAQAGVLIWRDLALDLWVPAQGQPLLLDADEYESLDLARRNPALHDSVQHAMAQLWAHATARTGPFTIFSKE